MRRDPDPQTRRIVFLALGAVGGLWLLAYMLSKSGPQVTNIPPGEPLNVTLRGVYRT